MGGINRRFTAFLGRVCQGMTPIVGYRPQILCRAVNLFVTSHCSSGLHPNSPRSDTQLRPVAFANSSAAAPFETHPHRDLIRCLGKMLRTILPLAFRRFSGVSGDGAMSGGRRPASMRYAD